MTILELNNIILNNKISSNVIIQSDSGWECNPTDCDGVFYSKNKNLLILTQDNYKTMYLRNNSDFICLTDKN